jgi:CheY-like chemotaxis protein
MGDIDAMEFEGPIEMAPSRLFVVDDNPEIGELIQDIALPLDMESVVITNSTDFKSLWLENKPDLLVLDMVMPDMDGFDLIQWLAKSTCDVPIILISGREEMYAKAASKLGKTKGLKIPHVLCKPFSVVDMETALNDALEISLQDTAKEAPKSAHGN